MGGIKLIERIIKQFKKERVKKVAPCHCCGDLTRSPFQEISKEKFYSRWSRSNNNNIK